MIKITRDRGDLLQKILEDLGVKPFSLANDGFWGENVQSFILVPVSQTEKIYVISPLDASQDKMVMRKITEMLEQLAIAAPVAKSENTLLLNTRESRDDNEWPDLNLSDDEKVLVALLKRGPPYRIPQSEFTEIIGFEKAKVSNLLENLRNLGVIKKIKRGRFNIIELTGDKGFPKAKEIIQKIPLETTCSILSQGSEDLKGVINPQNQIPEKMVAELESLIVHGKARRIDRAIYALRSGKEMMRGQLGREAGFSRSALCCALKDLQKDEWAFVTEKTVILNTEKIRREGLPPRVISNEEKITAVLKANNGQMFQKYIYEKTDIPENNVCTALVKMEKDGIVRRVYDSTIKSNVVYLTEICDKKEIEVIEENSKRIAEKNPVTDVVKKTDEITRVAQNFFCNNEGSHSGQGNLYDMENKMIQQMISAMKNSSTQIITREILAEKMKIDERTVNRLIRKVNQIGGSGESDTDGSKFLIETSGSNLKLKITVENNNSASVSGINIR